MKKKLIAMGLVVIMLSVMVPATAFGGTIGTTITVNPPSSGSLSLSAGDFKAYKLFDLTVSGSGSSKNYAYTPVSAVAGFVAEYSDYGPSLKTYLESGSADMYALTKDLMAYNVAHPGAFSAVSATQSGDSVKFDSLDLGYYLVVGSGKAPANADVIAHCALVTVDAAGADFAVDLKADAPSITKQVWNHNLSGSDKWDDYTDINMGTVADFRLISKVPDYTHYKSYTFTVHDTMSAGLTFDKSSVAITVGGVKFDDFSVVTAVDNPAVAPDSFIIAFDSDVFVTLTKGADIVITYSAELNKAAVIGSPGNPNVASLEFSNNPYTTTAKNGQTHGSGGSTKKTPDTEVIVYTFDLSILKVDGNGGAPLEGAQFKICDANGEFMVLVDLTGGNYRLADSTDSTTTTILTSPATGLIHIDGLDAGVYHLTETQAPDGYNLLTAPIDALITHIAETSGAHIGEYRGSYTAPQIRVENNAGGILPSTGGIGTTIFYLVGIILTAVLAIYFVASRKRNVLRAK